MQSLYYIDYNNTFEDDDGNILYDISDLLPKDKIMEYKQRGGTYYSSSDGETIEIDFPIRDNYRLLSYYQESNTFTDADDEIIVNIFSIITPNNLFMFKKNKENVVIKGIQGRVIDLLYI